MFPLGSYMVDGLCHFVNLTFLYLMEYNNTIWPWTYKMTVVLYLHFSVPLPVITLHIDFVLYNP